jgi:hypothetical protein
MRHIPCLLISACFAAAAFQWFGLLMIFEQVTTMAHKIGFGPGLASIGNSGLLPFFGGSAGLISLCLVSRRGLPANSTWRAMATVCIWILTTGAMIFAVALCTPYVAIADR